MRRLSPLHLLLLFFTLLFIAGASSIVSARQLPFSHLSTTILSSDDQSRTTTWHYDAAGNVTSQVESWPGDSARPAGTRLTNMGYDAAGHLSSEQISAPGEAIRLTQYHYDRAANRASKVVKHGGSVETRTFYSYNLANQLTSWTERGMTRKMSCAQRASPTISGATAADRPSHWLTLLKPRPPINGTSRTA